MATEVKLPEIGDGIKSVDVLDILVKVGDTIQADQGIVEIETDKATAEIPSPAAGKVVAIHVAKGDTVPIGGLLISLEGAATSKPTTKPAAVTPSAPVHDPPPTVPKPPPTPAVVKTTVGPAVSSASPPTTAPLANVTESHEIVPAGPSVRRFAREVGVDLATVQGSGPGGRITRDDVLAVVRNTNQVNSSQSTASHAIGSGQGTTSSSGKGNSSTTSTTVAPGTGVDVEISKDPWGPVHIQKMTKIRKTIANKMHESWSTVPRVTNFDDADVTELERMRQGSKDDYAKSGIKLTSMPFVIKAVALALKANPLVNASIDMVHEQIVYKHYVNIGIAVDTDRGLVVPSLRNADQLSIPSIARALQEIAESARTGSFSVDDLRGSTFSISNLGAIGGTYSTPIINTPEVAILLIGRSRKLPVVVQDEIAIRLMMPLSLSYDHRLVDGGAAARFLNDVIGFLSTPSRLLIAP